MSEDNEKQQFDAENIKVFKIATGEDMIGYINSMKPENNTVVIERPFRIFTKMDEYGDYDYIYIPYIAACDNKVIEMPLGAIITTMSPTDEAIAAYIENVVEANQDSRESGSIELIEDDTDSIPDHISLVVDNDKKTIH